MREEPRGTGTTTTRLRSCRNDKTRKNESTDGSMTIDDDRWRLEIEREASRRGGKSVGEIVRGTFYMPPDGETPRRPTSETLPRAIRRFLSLPPRAHPLPEWNVSHPVGPSCPASDPSSLLTPRSCFLHISFVIRRLVPARLISLPPDNAYANACRWLANKTAIGWTCESAARLLGWIESGDRLSASNRRKETVMKSHFFRRANFERRVIVKYLWIMNVVARIYLVLFSLSLLCISGDARCQMKACIFNAETENSNGVRLLLFPLAQM